MTVNYNIIIVQRTVHFAINLNRSRNFFNSNSILLQMRYIDIVDSLCCVPVIPWSPLARCSSWCWFEFVLGIGHLFDMAKRFYVDRPIHHVLTGNVHVLAKKIQGHSHGTVSS